MTKETKKEKHLQQRADTFWEGMPEYQQEKLTAYHELKVRFANDEDLQAFAKAIGQTVHKQGLKSIWYPAQVITASPLRYFDETEVPEDFKDSK